MFLFASVSAFLKYKAVHYTICQYSYKFQTYWYCHRPEICGTFLYLYMYISILDFIFFVYMYISIMFFGTYCSEIKGCYVTLYDEFYVILNKVFCNKEFLQSELLPTMLHKKI